MPGPRELPRYFIVGAKRAGTTSLDEYINAHPLVLRGLVEKGCRYYDVNYCRGPEWFRTQLLPVAEVDRLERKLGQRPILGESSPYYAFHPESAQRIAADVPDARLIFVLRDPVERAWSHYRYEVARGFETLDCAEAFATESSAVADPDTATRQRNHRHFSYAARSRYAEQLVRLRAPFDPEQVLVIESERLFDEPRATMDRVFAAPLARPRADGVLRDVQGPVGERRTGRGRGDDPGGGRRRRGAARGAAGAAAVMGAEAEGARA